MFGRLAALLAGLFGNSLARILTGAGLSLASYAALSTAISVMLNTLVASFSNLSTDLANMVLLMGVGQAISIIGAAMLTRAGLAAASLGLKRAAV